MPSLEAPLNPAPPQQKRPVVKQSPRDERIKQSRGPKSRFEAAGNPIMTAWAQDGGKGGSALPVATRLDPDSSTPITEQLRHCLSKNAVRVIDLFRSWDDDGNGTIDAKEFRRALATLVEGTLPREPCDQLFHQFDMDSSGTVEYSELNKFLRAGADMTLALPD